MTERTRPGAVRDAIIASMPPNKPMTVAELCAAVSDRLGHQVASSSVRSYLRLNTPGLFERTGHGQYKLRRK